MISIRSAAAGLLLLVAGQAASAEEVWRAAHTLIPGDVIREEDITAQTPPGKAQDTVPSSTRIVGLEVKRRIYEGHYISARDIGAVTAVKASSAVTVLWKSGDMVLELQGRALDAGAIGDEVRVLNPTSLRTIRGTVTGEGMVEVKSDQ